MKPHYDESMVSVWVMGGEMFIDVQLDRRAPGRSH